MGLGLPVWPVWQWDQAKSEDAKPVRDRRNSNSHWNGCNVSWQGLVSVCCRRKFHCVTWKPGRAGPQSSHGLLLLTVDLKWSECLISISGSAASPRSSMQFEACELWEARAQGDSELKNLTSCERWLTCSVRNLWPTLSLRNLWWFQSFQSSRILGWCFGWCWQAEPEEQPDSSLAHHWEVCIIRDFCCVLPTLPGP